MISRRQFVKTLGLSALSGLVGAPAFGWERKGWLKKAIEKNREKSSSAEEADSPVTTYVSPPVRVTRIMDNGGHLDWLHRPGGDILFDRRDNDGYFSLWISDANFRKMRSLTRDMEQFAQRHVGQPAWHPDGEWFVFQAQKSAVPERFHNVCVPGAGWRNDLWMMHKSGRGLTLVHDVGGGGMGKGGALHPHFSHSGDMLTWAERVDGGGTHGSWVLKLARLRRGQNSIPLLDNIQTFTPFGEDSMFYEAHGFDVEDRSIIFTITAKSGYQIARMDLATGKAWQLTNERGVWNEHAQLSPDGRQLVYISSRGLNYRPRPFALETEFWRMDLNGDNQQRLTYFHDPASNHHLPGFAVPADSSWRWDSKAFIGLVITGKPNTNWRGTGPLCLVELL